MDPAELVPLTSGARFRFLYAGRKVSVLGLGGDLTAGCVLVRVTLRGRASHEFAVKTLVKFFLGLTSFNRFQLEYSGLFEQLGFILKHDFILVKEFIRHLLQVIQSKPHHLASLKSFQRELAE